MDVIKAKGKLSRKAKSGITDQWLAVPAVCTLFCSRLLHGVGMPGVKNGKLFEDQPDRSFCRLAGHALHRVNRRKQVLAAGTANHGYDPHNQF